jgi:hypothetical protein
MSHSPPQSRHASSTCLSRPSTSTTEEPGSSQASQVSISALQQHTTGDKAKKVVSKLFTAATAAHLQMKSLAHWFSNNCHEGNTYLLSRFRSCIAYRRTTHAATTRLSSVFARLFLPCIWPCLLLVALLTSCVGLVDDCVHW